MQLKLALITHDPSTYMPAFFGDDQVPSTKTPPQEVQVEDFDPNDTAGEWKFTEEKIDPAEAERMLQDMLSDSGGVLSSADMGEWQ